MNILIVEDEREIAQLINSCLTREGFDCQVAYDGLSALTQVQNWQPDLIILDLMLPQLDGLEVCSLVRNQGLSKDPYILMLTAKGEEIDRVIGLSTGVVDTHIRRLRKKIEPNPAQPSFIKTVVGVGYKFED